ncbi:MAG: hypothetical protein GEV05_25730 [Betaproteobacteria bacterium]|nr:hypothetical protein [Betaproteobacteria bacterium]
MLTGDLTGTSSVAYTDVTPVSLLIAESNAFSVPSGSAIRNGKQLLERIRQAPETLTVGIAPGIGSHDHIALALAANAAAADAKKLKIVIFGGGDIIAALLGGHVDVMIGPVPIIAAPPNTGKMLWP